MNNNKSNMNAYKNPLTDQFVLNLFVEILAYKNRLIEAIEAEEQWEENAAAKQISWRLRTLQYSRSQAVANGIVVKAGLEKYGWKQVQEEERKTKSISIPKKKTIKLKLKSKH